MLTLTLILIVLGVIGWALNNKLSKPVTGTIVAATTSEDTIKPQVNENLRTPYYSVKYPARYDLSPKPAHSASLDAEILIAHQQARYGTGSRITLTVETAPIGGVSETSNYKLYKAEPNLYSMTAATYSGDPVTVVTRVEPNYQKIILWPHGAYLLTITLSSGVQAATTDADLQTIIDSLRW